MWDNICVSQKKTQIVKAVTEPAQRARLHAAFSPHWRAWLNAIPSSPIGLKLDDTQLRIAVAIRIGRLFVVLTTAAGVEHKWTSLAVTAYLAVKEMVVITATAPANAP